MTGNNNDYRILEFPNDISLPFFAYGIFKPGQLAYSKIKRDVNETINLKINYLMMYRDGVPILIDNEKDFYHTEGFIITFKKGHEKYAYETICRTLLRKLYKWNTIKINGNDVNILFGVDPHNGSDYIEDPEQRINFDGRYDPFFCNAVKLIEKNLSSNNYSSEIESFFELQMNYMLLWSAIDRYSSLKYNKRKESWNREKFANEKAFKEGIKKYKDEYHRPIFSTKDLKKHEFNIENSYKTLEYYYTLRCNVVHRGKGTGYDYPLLKQATEELLEIFKDVLKNTFDES